jgi:NADH-quinone oxidoreductase subunit C
MLLTSEYIQQKIEAKFGAEVGEFEDTYGMLSFTAKKDINLKVLQYLFDDGFDWHQLS